MTFNVFLREEKPSGNAEDKKPFQDITVFVPQLNFRLLDVIPSYNKKWGTLVIGVAPGLGWLYQEMHIAVKSELSYLYPDYDREKYAVQIGLGAGFVWQHTFNEGYKDDMYVDFGLRLSFGVLPQIGVRERTPDEEEAAMGSVVTEEMKSKDSDGDGLNDYCE